MKYYAVKVGKTPGIYTSWAECEANVKGYPGAKFKSFPNREDAEAFVYEDSSFTQSAPVEEKENMSARPYAFVDGSFNAGTATYGYGGFVQVGENRHIIQGAGNLEALASMRNVAGEIDGAMAAVDEARRLELTELDIYYDYSGIEKWATGEWKATKDGTKEYADFMRTAMQEMDIRFVKVKGHSGVDGNELADKLAKHAVGILNEEDMER